MARLKEKYASEIAPALMSKFGYKSVMQIPKLDKVVINCGCGEARDNPKIMDAILADLATITGQRPVVCKAKKSVANFKLREGCLLYTSGRVRPHPHLQGPCGREDYEVRGGSQDGS